MTPSDDKPKREPLPVIVLDLHDSERRENGEVVQLQPEDRAMIRAHREDEWENPVIAPFVYKPLTDDQIRNLELKLWRCY